MDKIKVGSRVEVVAGERVGSQGTIVYVLPRARLVRVQFEPEQWWYGQERLKLLPPAKRVKRKGR